MLSPTFHVVPAGGETVQEIQEQKGGDLEARGQREDEHPEEEDLIERIDDGQGQNEGVVIIKGEDRLWQRSQVLFQSFGDDVRIFRVGSQGNAGLLDGESSAQS